MEQIREAQSELVRLRGQWVRLDAVTLRAAEKFLDTFGARTREERRAGGRAADDGAGISGTTGPAAAGAPRAGGHPGPALVPAPVPAEVEGRAPWIEMFSLILSPEAADVDFGVAALLSGGSNGLARLMPGGSGAYPHPQPGSLQATLRPYQLDGLNWLWALDRQGLGGFLADDMGLGKTMQVLALLCREREGTRGEAPAERVGPTLLVCPMSVVGAWQREAATFAPHLSVHVHHGGDRVRDDSFVDGATDLDLVITTYSLLARDLAVLSAVPWHRRVFDEAQHVKTPATQVTRAARSLQAPHRLALTGTPVENRLADLHSLMEVVNPGLLGSAKSFQERVATPIEEDGD